ncbi:uncharacterized protein LOC143862126 [Tasmannia lanceolata]|uniref:uncharacterized protein LOC143862126 n=1 Tax=Tasmannia lanceolata TaxID=3420 RepID=UPI00406384FD
MLKKYLHALGFIQYFRGESRKKEPEEGLMSLEFSSQQNAWSVKIILPGRLVELYEGALPAAYVMEKYPGMCVARPEIFKRPQESLVRPEEWLLPGQKFYLVPLSTVKKIRSKQQEKLGGGNEAMDKEFKDSSGKNVINGGDGEDCELSICSAKDFYIARDKWSKCRLRKCGRGAREKKPFVPPIREIKLWQGFGWIPSLPSVKELSP